ncbi:Gluconolactonase precursor [Rosistilla oblonga]|uniref:SMP-30/gluconolactonase/LRE family protein n=1 Tax=Rosistilla oblonga TaxID=2527990 RepID=UPI0011882A00|nr:SMP-30/gluconolactonase/LRE family protein [Rosistilla oblonga]QDV13260.1 Gluconolactonase precursor [Rosistilla oblonga]
MTFALRSLALAAILFGLAAQPSSAQDSLGRIERLDPALDKLLAKDAKIEVLASGFTWSEGPLWVPEEDGYVLLSDIPRNSIFRWDAKRGVSLFMSPSGYTGNTYYGLEPGANGLALDAKGQVMMCEHGDRRVSVLTRDGGKRTLVDNYQGKRLNSPNDLVLHSSGAIYFTDPPYGMPKRYDDPRRELDFCGVYRLATDGTLTLISKELARPNGIGLSPDEKTLYVAQSDPKQAIWARFALNDDGTAGAMSILYDATDQVGKLPGLPDGLAIDPQGNLWASGPGGIYVFEPSGKLIGRLLTGQRTSNCTLGGPDGKDLFITADSYLCRVRLR